MVVASTSPPFQDSVASTVAGELAACLRTGGHEVEETRLPFDTHPELTIEQMLAIRLTDVSHAGELMVAVGSPSHLLEHPSKVVWFQPHDVDLGASAGGSSAAHRAALAGASRIYCGSAEVRESLLRNLGIGTELLRAPLGDPIGWESVVAELLR